MRRALILAVVLLSGALLVQAGDFTMPGSRTRAASVGIWHVVKSLGIASGTLVWTPTALRTLTLPDATDTLVGKATTDTLTNKSIAGSEIDSGSLPAARLPSYSNGFIAPLNSQNPASGTNSSFSTVGAAVGQAICGRYTQLFNQTVTRLFARVGTGVASQECDLGIFSADGTTLIGHTANIACATNGASIGSSSLSFALNAGTDYLACVAASSTSVTMTGMTNASNLYNSFGTNSIALGSATAGNKAAFNANCTASTAPYTCCTGSGTGTCTGFQGSLGTLATPSNPSAMYVLVGS